MSFKSMIQDMKGELGSISRKGFGLRSRSQRGMGDGNNGSAVIAVDGLKQSCWANIPPELLRDVLMRIEASECAWPDRKNVVLCGGVCRNWRDIIKELVKNPEFSGKLTFPMSLKQPGSRGSPIQCFIKRNKSAQTYLLYLSLNQASYDDGKFLLAAKKCRRSTCTNYIISLNAKDVSEGSSTYIGKLKSNFLGTKFTVYDAQPPNAGALATEYPTFNPGSMKRVSPRVPAGSYPILNISYDLKWSESRGPIMQCFMNAIPESATDPGGTAPTQTEFLISHVDSFSPPPLFGSQSACIDNSLPGSPLAARQESMLILENKLVGQEYWCMHLCRQVNVASLKNFQLVASNERKHDNVIMEFEKVGKDTFMMDYQYPLSAFQAFAICLSSFGTKVARE